MPNSGERTELARTVGLCARCAHAVRQTTARSSSFWRCQRAETDQWLARYPRLPVLACPGFDPDPTVAAG